jgi:hypothetical protein
MPEENPRFLGWIEAAGGPILQASEAFALNRFGRGAGHDNREDP